MKKFTLGICAFVLSLSLGWSPRVRAECAITGGRNGCLTLANPGEIRLDALKQAGHSIY